MIIQKSKIYLIFLILLPFANFLGPKMIFISIFFIAMISLFYIIKEHSSLNLAGKNLVVLISIFGCYVLLVMLNNINYVHVRDIFELFKYLIWIVIFLYAYEVSKKCNIFNVSKIFYYILLFEFFIILCQIFNIDSLNQIINYFFNLNKYFTTGRTTGTFSNPNLFGFWIIIIYFYIRIISKNQFNMRLFLLSLIMVVLSSSRTMLLLFLMFNLYYEFNIRKLLSIYGVYTLVTLSIVGYIAINFILASDIFIFKYLSELINLFLNGNFDLSSVSSFSQRLNIWSEVLNFINNDESSKFIFGFSPRKEYGFTFIDNQYLFTYFRWGILGSAFFYIIWIYIYYLISKLSKNSDLNRISSFLKLYIWLLVCYGMLGESFSSWTLVLPLFYFLGGGISMQKWKYTS